MAKKNTKDNESEPKSKRDSSSSHLKKQKIIGVVLFLVGIFFLVSIVSFSSKDIDHLHFTIGEVFGLHTPEYMPVDSTAITITDEAQTERHGINNLLGIWGAYLAHFTVQNTLGIAAIIFPFLIFLWAYSQFKVIELKRLLNISSFVLFNALCFSSFIGIFFVKDWLFGTSPYVPGKVGIFLASLMANLAGAIGAFLLILTALTILYIYTFDIEIEKIVLWLGEKIRALFTKKEVKQEDAAISTETAVKSETVSKEKKKKDKQVKPEITFEETEAVGDFAEIIESPDTVIRINLKETLEAETKKKGKEKITVTPEAPVEKPEKEKIEEIEESEVLALRQGEDQKPDQWNERLRYNIPDTDILESLPDEDFRVDEEELRRNAELLKEKLALFDIQIDDIEVTPGPVVTLFEIKPAPGVKISRIVALENDIALALAARGIRIIAPIPGKSYIGVEIPNQQPCPVSAKSVIGGMKTSSAEIIALGKEPEPEVLASMKNAKICIPLALGKTISGDIYVTDLAKMPHLLVAGSTGSGKSVGINMMLASILFSMHPGRIKIAIIDPKKIELSFYQKLRQHYLAICPDIDEDIVTMPMNAIILLKSLEIEMEKRYDRLAKAGVRHIIDYNIKISDKTKVIKDTAEIKHHFLPYIVVIVDELADLMITSGKEVEEPIARLAQLARAVGIHLVLATQRPSVNVITGVIKANFSSRISYQVATKIDSRTILDMNGAEQLLGRGDMLFLPPGTPKPIRLQNAFISTDEVERLTDKVKMQPGYSKPYYLPSIYEKKQAGGRMSRADVDDLFEDAARVVVQHQQGSVSLLQRRLKLGYARAARIVDQLEEAGIVGPNDGSKARSVLVENDEVLETILREL